MAKSGLSSGFGGMSSGIEFASSDMHRVPEKPFAPAQGLKALEGARASQGLSVMMRCVQV